MSPPIFSGPPIFVTLAILSALAVYLRQVSLSAQDLSDRIKGKHSTTPFPWDRVEGDFRDRKIRLLLEVRHTIYEATLGLSSLIFLVGVRIFLYALEPLGASTSLLFHHTVVAFDLVLAASMVILLGFMWRAHTVSRGRDEQLRGEVEASLKQNSVDADKPNVASVNDGQ